MRIIQKSTRKAGKGKCLIFSKPVRPESVNEIAVIFNGEISEKSIQRDLLDLVKWANLGYRRQAMAKNIK